MSRHRAPRPVRGRFALAWDVQPYSFTLAVVLAPVGLLAVITGDHVSRALSNLGAGVVSRVMGGMLLVGAVLVLVGIARACAVLEVTGLAVLAAGTALYGVGVILGLGLGGMVAGPGYLAVTAASLRRVALILALADEVDVEAADT